MLSGADLAARLFLPVYLLAYVLIGGPLHVAAFKRRYGFDPGLVRAPEPLAVMGESYRNALFAVGLVMVLVHALHPAWLVWFAPIGYLESPGLRRLGVCVLLGSLLLLRLGQLQLGRSWRYGIDLAGARTELITAGLYRRSRNPIYVALLATSVGLFLVLPNAVSFAIVNLAFLLLQVRIRVEERYLGEQHGEAYAAYRRRTPRWLWRIGPER